MFSGNNFRLSAIASTLIVGVAYTQEQIETKIAALEDAFSRHTLTVEFADRRVTYRSFNEIEQAINYWQRKLDLLTTSGRPKQSYGVAAKGFGAWADN